MRDPPGWPRRTSDTAGVSIDGWQREQEGCAIPFIALHPDATAMVLDDRLAYCEAQAGSFRLSLCRVPELMEPFENPLALLRLDAGAVVDHRKPSRSRLA